MRKIAFRKVKTFSITSEVFLIFPGCLDYRSLQYLEMLLGLFGNGHLEMLLSSYAKITHNTIYYNVHLLKSSVTTELFVISKQSWGENDTRYSKRDSYLLFRFL
jgi:hypothetical protein